MSRPDAEVPACGAAEARPGRPDEPVFSEPWQAQAFAMTLALQERGVFSWSEWASALSKQVHRPDAAADGSDYYEHWLAALEALLAEKRIAAPQLIDEMTAAWRRAAHATPHGQPILLENDPERA
ncbi:nitrile hydratase accessory protein [Pseudaminobacter soli (ex Zhang et al. 2022)]|uniref:nitrile hydratase accessory protein n=1 Tax=Pseudaminobacter soli (ex Zhang et al. 2022) TaxID=2831468 RepID=UPI002352C837|nr:nitrile hydratase accessory protein [Pseudaminobacter soli]